MTAPVESNGTDESPAHSPMDSDRLTTNGQSATNGRGFLRGNGSMNRHMSKSGQNCMGAQSPMNEAVGTNGSSTTNGFSTNNGHITTNHSNATNGSSTTNGHNMTNGHASSKMDIPTMEAANAEPIAIIGMSLKFPEEAVDSTSFWKMLLEQRCASTNFPKDRMNIDAFYDSDPKKQNRISTRAAHFLKEDVRAFDAPFFSVPPLEAATLDPQQRGLMETTYHALENAGLPMDSIAGSDTSVHVGCFTSDFNNMDWRDSQQIPKYSATGSSQTILANRISWFFDLKGPSMLVVTACSSAMIALDLAVNGLRAGTSKMAIVAGANLICSPEMNIVLSNMGMLSPDGRCYSFDHRANGYARGEGFGVLILKPISQALKDGDTIRALIRSVGTNQDGRTNGGITQPSQELQSQLIRETYRKAGLDMGITRFFEAHGTGTAIGDPTEARAVGQCFKLYRSRTEPLYVGAVKSNIGHLEGASGIAGIIKTVLILENGLIPPNTNFDSLNPNIDVEYMNLEFPTRCTPWPGQGLRRASVNSFGFGGSNAHVVLDDAYHYLLSRNATGVHSQRNTFPTDAEIKMLEVSSSTSTADLGGTASNHGQLALLTFSAADEMGTPRLAEAFDQYLQDLEGAANPEFLRDLAFTLNTRRTTFSWRSFAVVRGDQHQGLRSVVSKPVKAGSKQGLGFVFTGQGAQWFAMGRELLSIPTFMDSITLSQTCLHDFGCPWLLVDELMQSEHTSRVSDPGISQAVTTAIQIALVDLFQWLEVTPSVVVGHSSGEIAAAYCARFITQKSAIKIAYFRGTLASQLAATSLVEKTMVAVGLSRDEFIEQLTKLSQTKAQKFDASLVSVSCINSPTNITISGPVEQMNLLKSHFDQQGVFARRLKVNVAYHSPQMQSIASEYLESLGHLEASDKHSNVRMRSSVSCKIVTKKQVCAGQYWVENLTSPVNFLEAMKLCCVRGPENIIKKLDRSHYDETASRFWVEIGPHSALHGPIRDILKMLERTNDVSYCSALVRKKSATATVLEAAGRIWCSGVNIDMKKVSTPTALSLRDPQVIPDLPQYPFNHSTLYWKETLANQAFRFRRHARHSLLGAQIEGSNPLEAKWKFIITAEELPWVKDHVINGSILYPAAGMLVMAIEAVQQLSEDQSPIAYEVKDAEFSAPIQINSSLDEVEVFITLSPTSGFRKGYHFNIIIQKSDRDWERVCQGHVRADDGRIPSEVDRGREEEHKAKQLASTQAQAVASCYLAIDPSDMYRQLKDIGLSYGSGFQALDSIRYSGSGEAIANLTPFVWCGGLSQQAEEAEKTTIHPTTLDSCFQLSFVAMSANGNVPKRTMVPTRVDKAWVSNLGAGNSATSLQSVHCRAERVSDRLTRNNLSVCTQMTTEPRVIIEGLELTSISNTQDSMELASRPEYLCHHVYWNVDLDTMNNEQIHAHCEKAREPKPDPVEWFQDFENLALSFGARTLQELKQLDRKPCIPLERYTSWFQLQLDRHLAEVPAGDFEARRDMLYDPHHLQVLCDQMGKLNRRGELYVKIGSQLTEILLGDMDPVQVIFDDEQLLTDFYGELNTAPSAFNAVLRYLDAAAQKDPAMRFIEIGAGTGATTELVLKTIGSPFNAPRCGQYVFTDLSPSFFEKARERFNVHECMSYRTLNIEQDPCNQSFEAEAYDVVIATNVLHATRDLATTLKNTRKLLKPGGKLILVEMTAQNRTWIGFAFGLLPGWWLSSESYRKLSPCISEQDWNKVLAQNGFSGTDVVFQDYEAEECRGWSAMISTALCDEFPVAELPKATIVLDLESDFERAVAEKINKQWKEEGGSADMCSLLDVVPLEDIGSRYFILISDLEKPLLNDINPDSFEGLQKLLTEAGGIMWVTKGGNNSSTSADHGMVDGLCRVSRHENQSVLVVKLALESGNGVLSSTSLAHIIKVFKSSVVAKEKCSQDLETEYLEIEGLLHVNRTSVADYLDEHIFDKTTAPLRTQTFDAGPPLKLNIRTPGLLNSLEWVADDDSEKVLGSDEVLIEIHAIGLNFKDCMTALGKLHTDVMGSDCAGTIAGVGEAVQDFKIGDRVLACTLNTYRTLARANVNLVAKLPDGVTYVEGASMPTAFLTAYHCLHTVARLQMNETVLIHAASGGTGQATVQIARDIGAEIFALVGSLSKKELLMTKYEIPEDHIFYSRDTSFADGIRRMTNNRGVDVVFNSLSGDGLLACWELVAPFGRFVEIGKGDIYARQSLPMVSFQNNVSFIGFDLTGYVENNLFGGDALRKVMQMVRSGMIKPAYPLQVFPLSQLEQAFRLLGGGNSSGKIVVEVTKDALVPVVMGPNSKFNFDAKATYVVAGGFGGIGRSICRWLVARGARNLLLLSRNGPVRNEKAQAMLGELHSQGVLTKYPPCDIGDLKSLRDALECSGKSMPPIKGCFIASMVLRDSTFATMAHTNWVQATRPKVQGSWNLHTALPADMDFFILLSSGTGVIGNGGQSNYAAGNTYQDTLARYRCSHGQKAVSLDLGIVLSEGFVAENEKVMDRLLRMGAWNPIHQNQFFALLDYYCDPAREVSTPENAQVIIGIDVPANILAKGKEIPYAMHDPLFRTMHQINASSASTVNLASEQCQDTKHTFTTAETFAGAAAIVAEALKIKLSKILGLAPAEIDIKHRVESYGVDSLVAVELRSWLMKELSADVAVFEIVGGSTFEGVGQLVARKSTLAKESWTVGNKEG